MNKKILVCDDDHDILEITRLILEEEGYRVLTETGSFHLVERAISERPDLLLLDLWMPLLPGDELARQIRSTPELTGIPIVIFSATGEGKQRAMQAGADCFVTKPFDIDELLTTIDHCLHRSR